MKAFPMATRTLLALTVLAVGGCATHHPRDGADHALVHTPREAVMLAADRPDTGISGRFRMTVHGSGADSGSFYLNSEDDYRDQRNLTLRIPRYDVDAVARHLGVEQLDQLKGHVLEFDGVARRTRIDFTAGGQPTGKFYYQTHATLTAPDRIDDRGPASATTSTH